MNDSYAGGSRTAEGRPEQADGPGGWWRADDGYWYPPSAPEASAAPVADPTTAALQAAASQWATTTLPPGGAGDPVTAPVTMIEAGWGGNADTPPPLHHAPREAPRAPGMLDTFRAWPLWARIGVPVLAGFLVLGAIGAALGPPEEADTETAGTRPTTTVEPSTTTSRPTTTTSAPATTTTAPPTTTTTAPPTTTVPPTTAPPPPPPTTAAPPVVEPAPPPAQPSCHPSYSGCVPMASDVDCAGGSGDGPEYVSGPIQVVGSDEYGLDNDGDGVGCEA